MAQLALGNCTSGARALRPVRERRRARLSCCARQAEAKPAQTVEYKDSWTDIAFIALCRKVCCYLHLLHQQCGHSHSMLTGMRGTAVQAYGNIAGWQSPRPWREGSETYAGMVEVSRALMQVRSPCDAVLLTVHSCTAFVRLPRACSRVCTYTSSHKRSGQECLQAPSRSEHTREACACGPGQSPLRSAQERSGRCTAAPSV